MLIFLQKDIKNYISHIKKSVTRNQWQSRIASKCSKQMHRLMFKTLKVLIDSVRIDFKYL